MLDQQDVPDILTAATATRWGNCPGSAELELSFPYKPRRFVEGSRLLHEVAEDCLENNKTPGQIQTEIKSDLDNGEQVHLLSECHLAALDDYVDYVQSIVIDEESILLVNEPVSYNHIVPDGSARVDAIVIDEGVCHIIDLSATKSPVNVKQNYQLLIYALGAIACISEAYQCERFKLTSVQPLLHRRSSWEITRDELITQGDILKIKVKSALSEQPIFSPSLTACNQCEARSRCKPLAGHCMKRTKQHKEILTMYDANKLNPNQLSKILDELPLIKLWQESVEQKAIESLEQGFEIPGYKLTHTKPTLSWTNAQAAANVMNELGLADRAIYRQQPLLPEQILSPDEAKTRLGDDFFKLEKLIKTQQGEPSLVSTAAKKQLLIQPNRKEYDDPKQIAA